MKYYFELQYRRFARRMNEFGIHPVVAILLLLVVFLIGSVILFSKTDHSKWAYLLIGLSVVTSLSDFERIVRLKSIFRKVDFLKIRLIENGLLLIPFTIYLFFEQNYLVGIILLSAGLLLAPFSSRIPSSFVIPTPFKKIPFEFIVGFRKTILVILLSYFVCAKAIQVGNFNLGIASLGLLILISLSFYIKPEEYHFVWIYSKNVKGFLVKKLLDSYLCCSIIMSPIILSLSIAFFDKTWIVFLIMMVGLIFLSTIILAKYARFPKELNLPEAILFSMCFWFPPLLLVVLPIFYIHANRNLKTILE